MAEERDLTQENEDQNEVFILRRRQDREKQWKLFSSRQPISVGRRRNILRLV